MSLIETKGPGGTTRRTFLTAATAASLGLVLGSKAQARQIREALEELHEAPKVKAPQSANDRIRWACIGVGGKGSSDTADAARFGDIVAICDVDDNTIAEAKKKYPNAKVYHDYRKMLDEMSKDIDAVTVSTPDHHHYAASAQAMWLGKHVYCQKPLVHSLQEARKMAEIARKTKVWTQMGNQGTAQSGLRKQAAQVRAGIIGTIKEMHVWTNRPVWPQGKARGAELPVPANLKWDQWLGPAPVRPYADGYHTFSWRGWWDFGTGALGDMGCHTLNMPFMALDLRDPIRVSATTSGHDGDYFPSSATVRYEFEATPTRGALSFLWYEGGRRPPAELLDGEQMADSGSLLIGDKGKIYIPGDYGSGGDVIGGVDIAPVTFEASPGHFEELVRAIREGKQAVSNFPDYAGPLTEMVLAGNLAMRADGPTVEWDAKRQRIKNFRALEKRHELERMIRPHYRKGWRMP